MKWRRNYRSTLLITRREVSQLLSPWHSSSRAQSSLCSWFLESCLTHPYIASVQSVIGSWHQLIILVFTLLLRMILLNWTNQRHVLNCVGFACMHICAGTEDTPAPKPKPGMPCFHAGTSQYPCTTDGCRRLCEHQHHRSDKAYCKSISPGECCCPNE